MPLHLSTHRASLAGLVLAHALAGHAAAQSLPASTQPEAPAPATAPTTQAATAPADVAPIAPVRPPLLREGSLLVEAAGKLQRDPITNWWTLAVKPDDPGYLGAFGDQPIPEYKLIMLPSTTLQEMQRVLESTSGQEVPFEVTGQVLVFRGRNYLLAAHAARLSHTQAAATMPATAPAATAPSATTSPASMPATQPRESTEDIMRSLERSIGETPRHIASEAGAAGPSHSSPSIADASGDRLGFNVDAATAPPPSASGEKALREGTSVQSRRGKLTRDAAGAWMFVFDADATGGEGATGGADPPVRILPCLLLEKIEDYARRNPSTSPVLITGEIYLYNGRNYLLPTVYRVPQERTKIAP